eukprot:6835-Pyramimonas_sp.AAC.1
MMRRGSYSKVLPPVIDRMIRGRNGVFRPVFSASRGTGLYSDETLWLERDLATRVLGKSLCGQVERWLGRTRSITTFSRLFGVSAASHV